MKSFQYIKDIKSIEENQVFLDIVNDEIEELKFDSTAKRVLDLLVEKQHFMSDYSDMNFKRRVKRFDQAKSNYVQKMENELRTYTTNIKALKMMSLFKERDLLLENEQRLINKELSVDEPFGAQLAKSLTLQKTA